MKEHKLAAIVFTDIVGYTRQMEENEQRTMELLTKQREIVFPIVKEFGGKVIKEIGDGLLMMFQSANRAVRFAMAVQNRLKDEELTIRAGIHIGDVIFEKGDVFGSAVNTAARIEPLAEPNGICISEDVRSQIRNQKDIYTVSCGNKELKGVDQPIEIFKVVAEEKQTEAQQKRIPFFMDLWQRRVIQIVLIYLLVSYLIRLALSSIVTTYVLSPYLVDLGWTILLSLIPSVIILAYFHGKKGVTKWTRVELIGMPVNVVVAAVFLIVLFKGKDLGAATAQVTLENEDGEKIERVILKSEFRKKIALFFYDNISNDTSLSWMQYAIPMIINYDLSQNTFIQTKTGLDCLLRFRDAGYDDGLGGSLIHLKNIAGYYHMNYFVTGTFNYQEKEYVLTTSIYKTENAKLMASFEYRGNDVFSLVDQITEKIITDLELPSSQLENATDMPVAEIYTKSPTALEYYVKAVLEKELYNNWQSAINYLDKAIQEDEEFALAQLTLADYSFNSNNITKTEAALDKAMDCIIKLPESMQFHTKFFYYLINQEPDKAMAVLKMRTELFPWDIEAHEMLATRYQFKNMFHEAIEEYRAILRLDPGQGKYIRFIGDIYRALGNADSALYYYNYYTELYPQDFKAYRNTGEFYLYLGDFKKAAENLDKALILEPKDVDLGVTRLAIDLRQGKLENAEDKYLKLLKNCPTVQDSGKVLSALSNYYELIGQASMSLDYYMKFRKGFKRYVNPLAQVVNNLFNLDKYIIAGKKNEAYEIIKSSETILEPPVDRVVAFGYMFYYVYLDSAVMAEPYIPGAKEIAIGFGEEMLLSNINYTEGAIYEAKGHYDKAMEKYSAFLESSTGSTSVYKQMASCQRKAGNHKEAKRLIGEALKYRPYSGNMNLEAARIYEAAGETDQALEYLKRANKIWKDADADYEPAREAKEMLNTISL